MLYRMYEPGDFDALYALEEVCFQPPLRFSRAYMRKLTRGPESATWIAESNGELVGFAIVEWSRDSGRGTAYISTIEVSPGRRGEGIGAELLRRIEGAAGATGAESIWLHVDAGNAVAIRLYERAGYRRQGREENFYAHNRAAFLYAKSLDQSAA